MKRATSHMTIPGQPALTKKPAHPQVLLAARPPARSIVQPSVGPGTGAENPTPARCPDNGDVSAREPTC
jgi:hypothetical protein